jgi:GGDEF domain-containing protein
MGDSDSHLAPRVRPVADAPIEGLTTVADELAKAWAVALILSRSPSAIAEIPLEDLARDGPRLCIQFLRALQSDAELEELTGAGESQEAGARSLGSLAGADGALSVIAAVEALRGVLWEALLGELRRPGLDRAEKQLLSDLADRLAYVCAIVLAAALPASAGRGAGADPGVLVAGTGGPPPRPRGEPLTPTGSGGRGEVVIVDERESSDAPRSARVVVARGAGGVPSAERDGETAWSPPSSMPEAEAVGLSARQATVYEAAPPRPFAPATPEREPEPADELAGRSPLGDESEIQIRDERTEEGPAAWIRSIGRELERFALEGSPFAVLLIELMEAERLKRSEPPEEVARLAGQVQRTLESELWSLSERAGASLTREAPGRFWLLAPGIEALSVRALAERIEHAVRRSVSHHGQPVEIAVGTAVCPADGVQAAALAAHADVALYAARSGGSAGDGAAG